MDPYDGMQVLRGASPSELLGLLVEQRVPGVRGDSGGEAREQSDHDHGRRVGHQAHGEQCDARDGDRERQQAAPGQRGQHLLRAADADDGAAGQGEEEQGEGDGTAAEVLRVQYGDGRRGGDGSGDRGAGHDEEPDRARASLVEAGAGPGPAPAFQGGARAGRLRVGQLQEVQRRHGRGEEPRGDVRPEGRLVLREPGDAGAEQIADQRRRQQHGGSRGKGGEARTQRQPVQRVQMVRQRPHRRAPRRRRGQQRGGGALLGDRPEALGDTGDEDGAQEYGLGPVRGPVDPQRCDDQQGEPQPVRPDHRPAAVEWPRRRGQRGDRAQEEGSEEEGGKDPSPEHRGDREGRTAITTAERPFRNRRLKRQQQQHEKGEGVAGTADELCAPQPPERRKAQQGSYGSLA